MQRNFYDSFPITSILLLLIVGMYALEMLARFKLGGEQGPLLTFGIDGRTVIALGSSAPGHVLHGEVWRLVSCMFLHGSAAHIFMNGMVLVFVGKMCEPQLSSPRFFTSFVLCGLVSSLLGFGLSYAEAERVGILLRSPGSVGASGALAGFVGVLLVHSIRYRNVVLREFAIRWIVVIAVFSILVSNRVSIDHAGHLGGFATGCVLGIWVKPYTTSDEAARWRVPAYIAGGVVAVGLGSAVWNYFHTLASTS